MDARHYRANARDALQGRWGTAVLAGLIAAILCGGAGNAMNSGMTETGMGLQQLEAMTRMIWLLSSIGVVLGILNFIIGGAVEMGYVHFNLRMIDREEVRVGMIFSHIGRIGAGICMVLWRGLFMMLWVLPSVVIMMVLVYVTVWFMPPETLQTMMEDPVAIYAFTMQLLPLFLISCIPAIVAGYRYMLMPYIMAEHPGIRARDAMRLSREMMRGLKLRAFWLRLSFIGWMLLGLATFGIGMLWVQAYMAAAEAAFYRDICKFRRITVPQQEPQSLNRSPEF